jgi:hypothetical protein
MLIDNFLSYPNGVFYSPNALPFCTAAEFIGMQETTPQTENPKP